MGSSEIECVSSEPGARPPPSASASPSFAAAAHERPFLHWPPWIRSAISAIRSPTDVELQPSSDASTSQQSDSRSEQTLRISAVSCFCAFSQGSLAGSASMPSQVVMP